MYKCFNNSFYPYDLQQDYIAAGTWPDGGVDVDSDVYAEYALQQPPEGKTRSTNKKGFPCWVDLPDPTVEELAAAVQSRLNTLLAEATAAVAPLQDAVDLDIATDEEKAQLLAWKKYRVLLNRIELQPSFPTQIEWPIKPE